MKHKAKRSEVRTRELPPKVSNTPKGVLVQCPFCSPTHVILPGVESMCGTTLKVTAVQTYLTPHAVRQAKIKCIKCGQSDGEMVRCRNGFVHLIDCMPGTKLLAEIPPLSNGAKLVFKLPEKLRTVIEKRTGVAKQLDELNEEGKPTGKVIGYFFWKG